MIHTTYTAVLASPIALSLDTRITFYVKEHAEDYIEDMWNRRFTDSRLDFIRTDIEVGEMYSPIEANESY